MHATDTAESLAEEFKHYAYSVSHDISAPVRAMVEFSKLLLAEDLQGLSADGQEYLGLIVENGHRLQTMMEALLRYSRVNTLQAPSRPTNLTTVAEAIITELQARIMASGADITLEPLPTLSVDAAQIKHVLQVLIENALIYQPAGNHPVLHLSSCPVAGGVAIAIADNGIGIEPDRREVIFQPFKRLHTEEEYPGIGMGLTIAKKIIERHGGTLTCDDHTPNGSVFTFTLPAQES